jgi:hypothetical protein
MNDGGSLKEDELNRYDLHANGIMHIEELQ